MFKNLKIGTKLLLRIGVLVVGLLAFMAYAYWNRSTVQVGGPLYMEVVEGKDLLADIAPPPLLIMEANLLTADMLTARSDEMPGMIARGKEVKAEFEARHDAWAKSLEPDHLRDLVVDEAYKPAMEYFAIRDSEFIPALLAGDHAKAEALRDGVMTDKYDAHRAKIDEALKLAAA